MAATLLQEISKDEQERARFRSRRMFETDMNSNILSAEENGRIKGITEAFALIEQGYSPTEAKKRLGIS